MSLTIEPTITDLREWTSELSLVDHWLYSMWGIRRGRSSAGSSGHVQASSPAAAGWLETMWGFDV